MNKNVIIYGAGNNFVYSLYEISQYFNCVALTDGNSSKIGKVVQGYEVKDISDDEIPEYDNVIITPTQSYGIADTLEAKGIPRNKIIELQEALDSIPDDTWYSARHKSSAFEGDKAIAMILYGGMGDILIAKIWIERLLMLYNVDASSVHLFLSDQFIEWGEEFFLNIIPRDNIFSISKLEENAERLRYITVLRFCIIPEILMLDAERILSINPMFGEYCVKLDRFCSTHYNRGFFTTKCFYKTLQKMFIMKQGALYHTAYDVFGELSASSSNRPSFDVGKVDDNDYLRSLGLYGKKYITLDTGLNNEYSNKKSTRDWGRTNWKMLAQAIKSNYPEVLTVQVGLKLKHDDDICTDVHLNGKTTIVEIMSVLKNALVHIDYDGGLVHINHMVGGRSIVLMGSSSPQKHAYPENIYVSSDRCQACEWCTPDWLTKCPKGYDVPVCMAGITVDMTMNAIESSLGRRIHE